MIGAYHASKWGLEAFSQSFTAEVAAAPAIGSGSAGGTGSASGVR